MMNSDSSHWTMRCHLTGSFNDLLLKGEMSLEEMLEFCANIGFDAVNITAYYFPGYPEVPPDEFLYDIKRKAFLPGLDISGTGVRNDFTEPDRESGKNSECSCRRGNWNGLETMPLLLRTQ